ncbi:tRNA (N6-threonylcarbamoyladenosine(37)-N6)-methyltransferase TrmO [Kistimonas scapharcae]|uniref:tRNA (N6-threonylcarbamoyladenosine(37)-N6)-methyltransferase TrmO n=1 Tax=Kistimonas scapharcae TaxID=1036133 RepID=A0ABP8V8R4_9GAMM
MQQPSSSLYTLEPIGIIHSCYREKFGIPRQPGLATAATACIELLPPFNRPEAVQGLEGFSHLWLQFIFHQTLAEGWRPTIRPPRLGGETRVGVFASRSTHRPNGLGLSVVRLKGIDTQNGKVILELEGSDLLNGTPIVDIKPYLPWADAVAEAECGFAPEPPQIREVRFTPEATLDCEAYEKLTGRPLATLVTQVLSQDPRPAYLQRRPGRNHGIQLWDQNIRWQANDDHFLVTAIESVELLHESTA